MKNLDVEGYFVDEFGNVFTNKKSPKNPKGDLMKMRPWKDHNGYFHVALRADGKRKRFPIHRLVCTAYHGHPDSKTNICMHLNGNPSDNRSVNLKWGTQKENKSHELIHGTKLRGEEVPWSKYTDIQVIKVKKLLVDGFSYKEIAEQTGVGYQVVNHIARGKLWGHIPFPGEFNYVKKAVVKLTKADVIYIRNLLEKGMTQKSIAKQFGISDTSVRDIKCSRTWK